MLLHSIRGRNRKDKGDILPSLAVDRSDGPLSDSRTTSSSLSPKIVARLVDVDNKRCEISNSKEPGSVVVTSCFHVVSVSVKNISEINIHLQKKRNKDQVTCQWEQLPISLECTASRDRSFPDGGRLSLVLKEAAAAILDSDSEV